MMGAVQRNLHCTCICIFYSYLTNPCVFSNSPLSPQVYSWGNGSGVGKGTTEPRQYTPWLVETLEGEMIIDIATGDGHCLALTQSEENGGEGCGFTIVVVCTRMLHGPFSNLGSCFNDVHTVYLILTTSFAEVIYNCQRFDYSVVV